MKWDACYQYRVSKNRNDNNRLPVARSCKLWIVLDGITGQGNIIRRMNSLLARQEGSKTTSLYHSLAIVCSPLNSIGGVTVEFCFTVDMFDRLAFPITHYYEHCGNLPSSKTIAFQFRLENEKVRAVKTTQNLVSEGPHLQLRSNLSRDHLS